MDLNEVTKEFVRLFNEEEDFYECHELFELAWKGCSDPEEASFYKALVQVATAQFKLKKGILRGVRKLYGYAFPVLESLPDEVQGVDVRKVKQDFANQVMLLPDLDLIDEDTYQRYGLQLIKVYPAGR